MSSERRFEAASTALLVIGIANTAIIDLLAGWLGIDRELAFNVSLPVSTCLVTAVIAHAVFSRMRGFTFILLIWIDFLGLGVLLAATILLPEGTIPFVVKIAWFGHVVGWSIGAIITNVHTYIEKIHTSCHRQQVEIVHASMRRRIEELVLTGLRPADLELWNRARTKERTCPGCKSDMTFAGFVTTNVRWRPPDQLAKIWLDDRVQLRCCACYVASEPYLADASGNRVEAPNGPLIDTRGEVRYLRGVWVHERERKFEGEQA